MKRAPPLPLESFSSLRGNPRSTLFWVPRSRDIQRIVRFLPGPPRPSVVDVGSGSGLLSVLLSEWCDVVAIDPEGSGEFFPTLRSRVEDLEGTYDAAVTSWMEAGIDLREPLSRLSSTVVMIYDRQGGCGVRGEVSMERWGFSRIASWSVVGYEDVDRALREKGRGLPRPPLQGVVEIFVRGDPPPPQPLPPFHPEPYPWEKELELLGFGSDGESPRVF